MEGHNSCFLLNFVEVFEWFCRLFFFFKCFNYDFFFFFVIAFFLSYRGLLSPVCLWVKRLE